MGNKTIHEHLNEELKYNNSPGVKYHYFMWKNKLDAQQTKYSAMTEKFFKQKYMNNSGPRWRNMIAWEGSTQYKRLKYLLMLDDGDTRFVKMYEKTMVLAEEGDEKAIKTFLLMQKELRARIQAIEDAEKKTTTDGGGDNDNVTFDLTE